MRIRIPSVIVTACERFADWGDAPAFRVRGREVRRIDVLIFIGFVICVSYYAATAGWQGAVVGAALYILLGMIALWIL